VKVLFTKKRLPILAALLCLGAVCILILRSPTVSTEEPAVIASPTTQRTALTAKSTNSGLLNPKPSTPASEIVAQLDSGQDAPTGRDFTIGPDGTLLSASTRRVALLDQLGRIDPAAAAAYAEKILSSFSSPDEWAISLRNYALARGDDNARAFLQQKLREMLHYDSWQKNPSTGYLEAFDVAVHVGGTELIPDLTELLRQKDNQAVAHAAYLAVDRLTIQEPGTTLELLQREPDLMTGREATRANYFARANVEDDKQRAILEKYLLDPKRDAAELNTFAGLFPSGNFMISHNLLTRCETPTGETLARQDRHALDVVNAWLVDPRFEKARPYLEQTKTRLAGFVRGSRSTQQ
jgi:hypothetical protein